jgi:hypothetical protein
VIAETVERPDSPVDKRKQKGQLGPGRPFSNNNFNLELLKIIK